MRVNVGCGASPTVGWVNLDNSPSIRVAKLPERMVGILSAIRLVRRGNREFIRVCRESGISYADATRLPFSDESVDVVYCSHMLEHLSRADAARFLDESRRVLHPGGILRIVVPDLQKMVDEYADSGDADAFLARTLLVQDGCNGMLPRLRQLMLGNRGHQYMYDGRSLSAILVAHGFSEVEVLPAGVTHIEDPGGLNLSERSDESVYVEAKRP